MGLEQIIQLHVIELRSKQEVAKIIGISEATLIKLLKEHNIQSPSRGAIARATNLRRYGVEHPLQLPEIRERKKQTCLEKYGSEHPWSSLQVKEKQKNTMLKKYGVENPSCNQEINDKRKQTVLKKYGVEHVSQSTEVQQKRKRTCLERYGAEYPLQSEHIRQKIRENYFANTGVYYPLQSASVLDQIKKIIFDKYNVFNILSSEAHREQIKETNLKRYGALHPMQNEQIKQKQKNTCQINYGVDNTQQKHNPQAFNLLQDYNWLYDQYVIQQKTAMQIANELNIDGTTVGIYLSKNDIVIRRIANFSRLAISWLNKIAEEENIVIQHALNGGEYRIPKTKILVDGYCMSNNTVYEFYGDLWHGNPRLFKPHEKCHPFDPNITAGELYKRTKERENKILTLNYNLVVKWESG